LQLDGKVRTLIEETTSGKVISDSKRNSAENVFSWSKRLSPPQVELIRQGTDPLWRNWYSDTDWKSTPVPAASYPTA
jgi:hypothetical protein